MKVYLGNDGLGKSWQNSFTSTIECKKCGGEARIMFIGFEGKEKNYICNLRKNGGKGDFWVHDACAIAVYLCRDCFEPNALLNQA